MSFISTMFAPGDEILGLVWIFLFLYDSKCPQCTQYFSPEPYPVKPLTQRGKLERYTDLWTFTRVHLRVGYIIYLSNITKLNEIWKRQLKEHVFHCSYLVDVNNIICRLVLIPSSLVLNWTYLILIKCGFLFSPQSIF